MAHTYTNLLTHLIFSTKDRVPSLDADLKARLFPYLGGISDVRVNYMRIDALGGSKNPADIMKAKNIIAAAKRLMEN